MRTKQLVVVAGIVGTLVLTAAGCSSSGDAAATSSTVAAAKNSSDGGAGDNGGGAGDSGGGPRDGESVALPDGWPEELALPSDVVVLEVSDSALTTMVVGRNDGTAKATFDSLKAQLTDGGWEIVQSNFSDSPQGGFGGISARNSTGTVAITFGPDPTGDTSQVTILYDET